MSTILKKTLVIDIGGSFIKYGIVECNGSISSHYKIALPDGITDKSVFWDLVCEGAHQICNNGLPDDISLIGISCPGLISTENIVQSYAAPRLSAIHHSDIGFEISSRTGLPASAINDARAAGLCEITVGAAKGTSLSAFLIIGTGAGGCIGLGNRILGGIDNFAGEFHFMCYPDERNGETIKTGRSIGTFGLINRYNASTRCTSQVKYGREITERAFKNHEPLANDMVQDWIHRIALQCLSIIVCINPEVLCIGGGISEESWFTDSIRNEYLRICEEHFAGEHFLTTKIISCRYHNDSNLLGAAIHVNNENII